MIKSSFVGKDRKTLFVVLVLLLGVIFQSWNLIPNISQDLNNVWRDKGQPALWRSARYNQGYRFAGFVQFLIANVPKDGVLILPPGGDAPKALTTTPFMQFFLMPRKVINCPNNECYPRFLEAGPYLLIISNAQEAALQKFTGARLMYDQEWGLLIPDQTSRSAGSSPIGFITIAGLLKAGVLPGLWLAIMVSSGFLLVRKLAPGLNGMTQLVLGFGLSFAFLSLVTTILSLIGLSLTSKVVWSITLILLFLALLVTLFGGGTRSKKPEIVFKFHRSDLFLLLPLALGGMATLISIGKGYSSIDAIQIWGVKGYGIASSGTVKDITTWGTNTLPYPLQIPVIIACFKLLFGETLPASKILFSGYYLALIVFIYAYYTNGQKNRFLAGLACLLIGTSPLVFRHGTIGYANLALSFYLVVAVTLLSEAVHDRQSGFGISILSGIFFGAASWTRPEGWALACIGLGFAFSVSFFKRRRDTLLKFIYPAAALVIYEIFWIWILKSIYSPFSNKSNLLGSAIFGILAGELHLSEAFYIAKYFLLDLVDVQTWGFIGTVIILLTTIMIILALSKKHIGSFSQWVGFFYVIAIILMYYIVSYDIDHDISWWVSTGFDRMLLPGMILIGSGWLELSGKLSSEKRIS